MDLLFARWAQCSRSSGTGGVLGRIEFGLRACTPEEDRGCPKRGLTVIRHLEALLGSASSGCGREGWPRKWESGREPLASPLLWTWASVLLPWRDSRWPVSTEGVFCGALHPEDPGVGMLWGGTGALGNVQEGDLWKGRIVLWAWNSLGSSGLGRINSSLGGARVPWTLEHS